MKTGKYRFAAYYCSSCALIGVLIWRNMDFVLALCDKRDCNTPLASKSITFPLPFCTFPGLFHLYPLFQSPQDLLASSKPLALPQAALITAIRVRIELFYYKFFYLFPLASDILNNGATSSMIHLFSIY